MTPLGREAGEDGEWRADGGMETVPDPVFFSFPKLGKATQKTSVLAMGLAASPVPRISRITPPAPVAAPPYGSMALGWLWVSALKQTASVSSKAMTPALSAKTERQKSLVAWAARP